MHWVTYTRNDEEDARVGVVSGSSIHAAPVGATLLQLLTSDSLADAGSDALASPDHVVELEAVRLLAPLPQPPSVRDFMSFEAHVVNGFASSGREVDPVWYEHPSFYFSNPASISGPNATVTIFPGSSAFDLELEIAAVVGRAGSNVRPRDAAEHIAGYAIMCDWSARDLQRAEGVLRLGPSKGKDGATSLGPWLVTPDELADARTSRGFDLAMEVRVNGRHYSSGNWADIHWSFEQMLAYASRGTRIVPGDVFGSGTMGTGCLVELRHLHGAEEFPWLVPGDEVELTVDRLGTLRTIIGAQPQGLPSVSELLSEPD